MKKINFAFINQLLLVFMLISLSASSQNNQYGIGHTQITFIDSSRSNRSIQTEIYYPSTTNGDNTPFATGQFPLIVFGHGFVMAWSSYQWLWDSIVPKGYIMAFPRTEGSISPSHSSFGTDLAFLNNYIKIQNSNSASIFYLHVSDKSAIMGHSMGGGASFLAAENNTNLTTLVNFAAANTNPSSISAATNVTVPLLVFSGENDGVAPPSSNQLPMYDSASSTCKTYVSILGGGHCYFADYNFNCSFGEGTTSPQPTISQQDQHTRAFNVLKPYLNYYLNNDLASWNIFNNEINITQYYNNIQNCNINSSPDILKNEIPIEIYSEGKNIHIKTNIENLPLEVKVYNCTGILVKSIEIKNSNTIINMDSYSKSLYFVTTVLKNLTTTKKIFIN